MYTYNFDVESVNQSISHFCQPEMKSKNYQKKNLEQIFFEEEIKLDSGQESFMEEIKMKHVNIENIENIENSFRKLFEL